MTLQTLGGDPRLIVFSEWDFIQNGMVKRRDFSFKALLAHSVSSDMTLFSDSVEDILIPKPAAEFPPIHYLKIGATQEQK